MTARQKRKERAFQSEEKKYRIGDLEPLESKSCVR